MEERIGPGTIMAMEAPTERVGHYIETFTGRQFYVLDVRPEDIALQDIAHGLSRQCRYNGQCQDWYSVAEHSALIAGAAFARGHTPAECLQALLHDAAEAYVGDLPKPIKKNFPGITEAEENISRAIMEKFGLPTKLPAWLKDLDRRIVVDERKKVMLMTDNYWKCDDLKPIGANVRCLERDEAKQFFLDIYRELTESRLLETRAKSMLQEKVLREEKPHGSA